MSALGHVLIVLPTRAFALAGFALCGTGLAVHHLRTRKAHR